MTTVQAARAGAGRAVALVLLLLVCAASSGRALGQDAAENLDRVDQDYAEKYLQNGEYDQALSYFARLNEASPKDIDIRLKYALCLFETGKLERAEEEYDNVRKVDRNNIVALIQKARVIAKRARLPGLSSDDRQDLLAESRGRLLDAASLGANCLRELRTIKELKVLFENDVKLQIDLVKATYGAKQLRRGRDPFQVPVPRRDEVDVIVPGVDFVEQGVSQEEQRELIQQLRQLVRQIDELIDAKDFDGIAAVWEEIEDIFSQHQSITMNDLQTELNALRQRHQEKKRLVSSLILRAQYRQGLKILEEMKAALGDEEGYVRVFELWRMLNRHAKRMIETEQDWTKTANQLLEQGRETEAAARQLEAIAKFKFDISAILAGAGVAKAIINGYVVAENGTVREPNGRAIPDVSVVAIRKRRIRFHFKGTVFERSIRD